LTGHRRKPLAAHPACMAGANIVRPGKRGLKMTRLLQCREKLRTFNDMMNSQATLGFRHLRRFWNGRPGWVAV
jgi:hypothetical protein